MRILRIHQVVATAAILAASTSMLCADGVTIGYYDLNGDAMADVGSNNGVAGVNVGFATVAGRDAAVFGSVIDDANVADDIIGFSSAYAGFGSDPFSISLWVNTMNTAGTAQGVFDLSGDGGDGPQMLFSNASPATLIGRLDGTGASNAVINAGAGFDNGAWHFAVLTYSGTTFEFFVNNVSAGTGAVTAPVNWNTDQYLGAFNLNGNGAAKGLDGALDDFAIYAGVLSAQQRSDLFAGNTNPGTYAVPEPASALMLLGLSCCLAVHRRRN